MEDLERNCSHRTLFCFVLKSCPWGGDFDKKSSDRGGGGGGEWQPVKLIPSLV